MASQRFDKVYEDLNHQWYYKFYGQKPKGEYRVVNALGNGGNNYGPRIIMPNGEEVIYAIIGTTDLDNLGMPKFEKNAYIPTLLHELNHSFVNHLIGKFKLELQESGEVIYKPLESKMRKQAYSNWQTMFSEALVRASVIKYMKDNSSTKELIEVETNEQLQRGFLWTDDLVKELEHYDNNRDTYPTLESFMPELISFFNQTALNIDFLMKNFNEKTPKVISLQPLINDSINVDHTIKSITVNFDQALSGRGHSINYGNKGKKAFPKVGTVMYSADYKAVNIEVSLEPNKEYQFVLTGLAFKSKEGYEMADYEVNFKTKK